jgi:hypothetical protein
MGRFTGTLARSAFGVTLAVFVGTANLANATQSRICAMGGGIKNIVVQDDRNIFALPAELVKYGTWACIEVSAGAGAVFAPTTKYLGLENGGGDHQIGIYSPTTTAVGPVFDGSIAFGPVPNIFAPNNPAFIELGVSGGGFSSTSSLDVFNPQGNQLLIFDPQGGFLNFGPGFNEVRHLNHSRNIDLFSFNVQSNMPLNTGRQSRFGLAALIGLEYTNLHIQERFTASLPASSLDFGYAQDVTANVFTPRFGMQVDVPLGLNVAIIGQGWVGPAIVDASGQDRFFASGASTFNVVNPLSSSHVGFAGAVGLGVRYSANGTSAAVSVNYKTSESNVTVFRSDAPGVPSKLEVSDLEVLRFAFGIQKDFNLDAGRQ